MRSRRLFGTLLLSLLLFALGAVSHAASATDTQNQEVYPHAPADLHLTDSSKQTSLTASWTAVAGATGYRIGRNGVALTDTTQTTYSWTGLTCGTTYRLSVQPEQSTKDTGGDFAVVTGTTASCNTSTTSSTSSSNVSATQPATAFTVTSSVSNGSTLTGQLAWTATPQGATTKKVEFLIDGALRWTESYAPYRFNGDNGLLDTKTLSNGSHTLTVIAYATTGQTATATASVTIANGAPPPAPAFTTSSSVVDGSTLSGSLAWTATPQGATTKKVEFLIDGALRWTESYAPYRLNGDNGLLDTKTLSNGSHTLTVIAYATTGQTATAKASVTVANNAPLAAPSTSSQTYPNAPTDLLVTASQQTSITAAWTAVGGASAYRISRDGVALVDTSHTTYTWTGLTCGTTYRIGVQPEQSSKDASGNIATTIGITASCGMSTSEDTFTVASGTGGSVVFKGEFQDGKIAQWLATPWGAAQCSNYGSRK